MPQSMRDFKKANKYRFLFSLKHTKNIFHEKGKQQNICKCFNCSLLHSVVKLNKPCSWYNEVNAAEKMTWKVVPPMRKAEKRKQFVITP